MRKLTEYGAIVKIPRIYISEMIRENDGVGYWPAIVRLIQLYTDIELPDTANVCGAFDMATEEEFESNSILVRISTLENIPGLFQLAPGMHFPHMNLRIHNEQETA